VDLPEPHAAPIVPGVSPAVADLPLSADDSEVSIVLPRLDEAAAVADCVREALAWLTGAGVAGEVVVADNGSRDGSPAIAAAAGARVVAVATRGYGAAVRAGLTAARGRYVIVADADGSYDLSGLGPFLDALRAGNDLVVGNRFAGGVARGAMPWANRWLGNPLLSGLGRLLYATPVRDFHCGLRGCARVAMLALDLRSDGMELASEMITAATRRGLRVAELPTTLRAAAPGRSSKLRPVSDGLRHIRLLIGRRWGGR